MSAYRSLVVIVVEGFDGSGKTTLATKIADELGWELHRIGGSPETGDDLVRYMRLCRTRMRTPCVQDRITYISEAIYSLYRDRGRTAFCTYHMSDIAPPTSIVYCRPSDRTLRKALAEHVDEAWDDHNAMLYVREHAEKLVGAYDAIMMALASRTLVHWHDRDDPKADEKTLDTIRRIYEKPVIQLR